MMQKNRSPPVDHLEFYLVLLFCTLGKAIDRPNELGDQQIVVADVDNGFFLTNGTENDVTENKRKLVPLNDAVVVPLAIPTHPIHDYDAPNLSEFSSHTNFTDQLMNMSRAFVNDTLLQFVTEDYVRNALENFTMMQIGNLSYGSAFLSLLDHPEAAALADFGNRMLAPAIMYPLVEIAAIAMLVLRLRFGFLGSTYQAYSIRKYGVFFVVLVILLFVFVALLGAAFVVTTIAASGLVKGIYYFPETIQKVLADFLDAVSNMRSDFERLRVTNMDLLFDELNDHIAGFADLVSDAVWSQVDSFIKTGVSTLNSTLVDVVTLQTELGNINKELGIAADVFDNVTERFLKERLDLLAFKNVCTTPLFCDRINTDVFLLTDVNSKTLNIDSRVKEATDILESGMLRLINNSTYLFEKIGYLLQGEIYNNFSDYQNKTLGRWRKSIDNWTFPIEFNLTTPMVNALVKMSDGFHLMHHSTGSPTAWYLMWILFVVDGMLLLFALAWLIGGLCGCCNYETIVLPTSRELPSDFSGLLLMGVSYTSLFLSTILILVGIVFVVGGTVGTGLVCPSIRAENFSEVAIDQLVASLIEQKPYIPKMPHDHSMSYYAEMPTIGKALEICNTRVIMSDMLDFRSLRPKGLSGANLVSGVGERYSSSKPYFRWIRNITDQAKLKDELRWLHPEKLGIRNIVFYPEALRLLMQKYQKVLDIDLTERKKTLMYGLDDVMVMDAVKELGKIAEGLIEKPHEQTRVAEAQQTLVDMMTTDIGPAKAQMNLAVHHVDHFIHDIGNLKNTEEQFESELLAPTLKYSQTELIVLATKKTEIFKARLMGFIDQYIDNYLNMTNNHIGLCQPILQATDSLADLLCDWILGNMVLVGFGLIYSCFFFPPTVVISVLLSRQLLIQKGSNYAEDHYERAVPVDVRKLPFPKPAVDV